MKLRPHHLLDIINKYGHRQTFEPHPYGHAVHRIAQALLADLDLAIQIVVAADDICEPCKHLKPDGQCDDTVASLRPPVPKQQYNDQLDIRVLGCLGLRPNTVLTARQFLQIVGSKLPGLASICVHPGETQEYRLKGLVEGLRRLASAGPAFGTQESRNRTQGDNHVVDAGR
jgi:hypothetical protein